MPYSSLSTPFSDASSREEEISSLANQEATCWQRQSQTGSRDSHGFSKAFYCAVSAPQLEAH